MFSQENESSEMDNEKNDFAELCECIWDRIISEKSIIDWEDFDYVRKRVTISAMTSWNICVKSNSYAEARRRVATFHSNAVQNNIFVLSALYDTAELKWREFRNDKTEFVLVEVKDFNGNPRACAYRYGETPDSSSLRKLVELTQNHSLLNRLQNVSFLCSSNNKTDHLLETINESHPQELKMPREYPVSYKTLERVYDYHLCGVENKQRECTLKKKLWKYPILLLIHDRIDICLRKNKLYLETEDKTIAGLILTIVDAYEDTTDLSTVDMYVFSFCVQNAVDIVSCYYDDKKEFDFLVLVFGEPDLIEFICKHVDEIDSSYKKKQTMVTMVSLGLFVAYSRYVFFSNLLGK